MDATDLRLLSEVLERADRVLSMEQQFHDGAGPNDVVLRHDVDGNNMALDSALVMARWEAERGYRSTYYMLHGTRYWTNARFPGICQEIASLGHEIGFHNNALAIGLRERLDPFYVLNEALTELRDWTGLPVESTAAHGDSDCTLGGYVNYMLFQESYSPYVLDSFVKPSSLGFAPRPLADYGFKFQGDWLPRPHYLTDSGGGWSAYSKLGFVVDLEEAHRSFPWGDGHLTILQHPDWWPVKLYG